MKKSTFYIILSVILIILGVCFFRTKEIKISYDGVEERVSNAQPRLMTMGSANSVMSKSMSYDSIEVAEMDYEAGNGSNERYQQDNYIKVETEQFDKLLSELKLFINSLQGTIKTDEQKSNQRKEYDTYFNPRFKYLVFTVDSEMGDLEHLTEILNKYGIIREQNSNIVSKEKSISQLEQEIENTKKMIEVTSPNKDKWQYTRYNEELLEQQKRLQEIKNKTTYVTYTLRISEVIPFRVNAIRYWYENNYKAQEAMNNVIPLLLYILVIGVPGVIFILLFIYLYHRVIGMNTFQKKLEILEKKSKNKGNLTFQIKL